MSRIAMDLVILEQMVGYADNFRMLFQINPKNHSGRRLYKLMPSHFVVGDSVPHIVPHATMHGVPCHHHLQEVFKYARSRRYAPRLIVLGGKVAKQTFKSMNIAYRRPIFNAPVVVIPHPAARMWTNQMVESVRSALADFRQNGLATDMEYLPHVNQWSGINLHNI